MSEDETAKLWKVNRTIHELVKDRVRYHALWCIDAFLTSHWQGYQVSDDEINMDLTTFRSHYANSGGSVESVAFIMQDCALADVDLHFQSKPTQFFHELQRKSNRPDFYILFRGEKRRC